MNYWHIKITGNFNRIFKAEGGYLEGCVVTPHGIVTAYSQGGNNEVPHTTLQFAWDGRLHCMSFDQRFTARGLVTKARRFADDIVEAGIQP